MPNKAVQKKTIQMAVFGMDSKSLKTLDFAMEKMGKGLATFVGESESEAAIFNFDNPDVPSRLDEYHHSYPENGIIILSVKNPERSDCVFLKKPFDMNALLGSIRQMQKLKLQSIGRKNSQHMSKVGVSSVALEKKSKNKLAPITPVVDFQAEKNKDRKYCGMAGDIDLTDIESRSEIYYQPEESLQSKLQDATLLAKQKSRVVIVAIKFENDLETITLLPRINKVIMALDGKKLSYLCTVPLYCLEIKVFLQNVEKSRELEDLATKRQGNESVDALLWNIALWTSRGRIPAGTNLNTSISLKHWPNFTRLHVTPGVFSIAALLHDKPMSLTLLIKILSIPQRYVFAFYSAAQALDLIEMDDSNMLAEKRLINQAHPHRRLFGLIMQKIKRVG
ncbi:hypothetical protein MNBD_GAMMA25-473 [hydrothermal vent metagenome]|uniref:Uncharacterized protein n=1 Tax=hydrothermal vent metagenome TaxID=652676 RepID=A0A3B1AWT2_9ZZZZ